MEVKINKEIRDYTESVYFGLSLRQFIFSLLACFIALIVFFIFKPFFNIETLSWLCIISSLPFAVIGFVKYNGMNAEEFLLAYLKSEIFIPKQLLYSPFNYYYEIITKNKKGDDKKNDKDNQKCFKAR